MIEGLRTDSLYLFDVTLFGQPVRVSQALSFALVIAGFTILLVQKRRHPRGQNDLFVTKQEIAAMIALEETKNDSPNVSMQENAPENLSNDTPETTDN